MAYIVSDIVSCLGDKTWLHSETFVTKFLAVTAPSLYCYCGIAVNKCAVTAACHGSRIVDLALTTTLQPELCIPWRRFTHMPSCHTLIPTVLALDCASSLTGKIFRHLGWDRNSCYCIDVFPRTMGLYSLGGKMSYHQISRRLEAVGLGVIVTVSLWNLIGTSAALLLNFLPNIRAIGKV